MDITPETTEEAVDSHSLVTLFALAMDAKAREWDSPTIRHLFQEALNRANNLDKAGRLKGDLVEVKANNRTDTTTVRVFIVCKTMLYAA